MRLAFLLMVLLGVNCSAQTVQELEAQAAKLPPLRASIYGAPLTGARELDIAMAGKSEADGRSIFRAAARPVKMGESFQVTVKTAQGTPVTSDPRTRYAAVGCLIVSTSGFVTVTENIGPCRAGMLAQLWVSMVGANKQAQAGNQYYFVIAE